MSNKNFDVELPITYDEAYKHYIPTYTVSAPYCADTASAHYYSHNYFISLDEGPETEMGYCFWYRLPSPAWAIDANSIDWYDYDTLSWKTGSRLIPDTGVFEKIYFRNPHRNINTFTTSNCAVKVLYQTKASFEIQWNLTGFAANSNAFFRCSTVQKNIYRQYEWTSATVYYKKTTDENYQSVAGTISGTWSDYTISTSLTLADGYTYDIYITAISDDNETATTPVAQFTTTDADAIATCIAPSGTFTNGPVTFVWSHSTAYGTQQYAYDLQYSNDNGATWTIVKSHEVTQQTTVSATLTNAGIYLWRVRTYNSNDVAGEWAHATFVNNIPAVPPTNLFVNTKGRPTVSWATSSQSAYQVQFLLGDNVVYDSGAVYTSEKSHFVNKYFDDNRSYTVRVRIYNALGEISEWTQTGYQQPAVDDVEFSVGGINGATLTIVPNAVFKKYYVLRNNKCIGEFIGETFSDPYAVGQTNYSVVGVTSDDQSDMQSIGYKVTYDHAYIVAQNGERFLINKRVNSAYEVQTSNQADINKASFIGDNYPTHYSNNMRLKTFIITCFDNQNLMESLLGTMVYYADNFGNGGWCMVSAYDKTDNFVRNGQGVYANEISLTLEVTSYDDSIEYPI